MSGFNFWQFLAGVSLFLYAMNLIEDSVKNISGRDFKKFLQKQSRSKLKMTAASTVGTAFLQSSSVVLLMVITFVGAGLINLRGALAAVLGANLGTTLDSWVVALVGFKIDFHLFSFPLLGIALFGLLFFKPKTKMAYLSNFIIGFAFIFIALDWLKGCVDQSLALSLMKYNKLHYLFFVPIGFVLTAIIQSSSVTIAITLSALYNHIIPFESAAAIVIGSELGTTLKFLFNSAGSNVTKKQVAWGNFIINFLTLTLAAIFLRNLTYFVRQILGVKDVLTALVLFQTGINLVSLVLFYPLLNVFARMLEKFIPNKTGNNLSRFIGKNPATSVQEMLEISEKEIMNLISKTIDANKGLFKEKEEKETKIIDKIKNFNSGTQSYFEEYENLKKLQGEILNFLSDLPKDEMSAEELISLAMQMNAVRHVMRSAKNMKDIIHNLTEFENSANDILYGILGEIRKAVGAFYNDFQILLEHPSKAKKAKLSELTVLNRKNYDEAINTLLPKLNADKINEIDSANLINVYREIYSSNKGLIRTVVDLKDLELEI